MISLMYTRFGQSCNNWVCTWIRYIAPEQVPVQYGGLSKEGETEFTTADVAIEETIKPTCKHSVELPITEVGLA